jgi:autotransporter adhesin
LVVSNTVAIGNSAVARADGAVAIGNGAEATRTNQFAFGTTANTYTMAGIGSAASRAAQTGPTQIVTSDGGGNLATASAASLGLASAGDIGAINSSLGDINNRINDLNNRTSKATTGVAMAFAMAGVPTLMPHEQFAAAMNWGTFQGANGLALNTAVRISNNVQLNGGVGYGADERLVGGRLGLRVGW